MHRMLGRHRGVPGRHARDCSRNRSLSNARHPRYACWAVRFWLAPSLAPSGSHTNPAWKLAHGSLSRHWIVGFALSYHTSTLMAVGIPRYYFASFIACVIESCLENDSNRRGRE
ncbi:hypothetical protein CCMA1212_001899 [Trichoderma ghanense]|uniref:Uncharacterized protein n=1 Tax=Trichoderma ghanense TaxID=65468 RepID=A0ABY2HCZ4_9HYPO